MFSVTWMLGKRCNYDCMYCPTSLHDDVSKPHDLDVMQQAWRNIHAQARSRNLPFKISFTGGEVTANRNFLPLVTWMRSEYPDIQHIQLTTNGSASLQYYTKLAHQVESMSFSTHSEHMDEQEFFSKAQALDLIMIRPTKSFHVNIMDEFWNKDRVEVYKQWLTARKISHSINVINYQHQTRDVPIMKGRQNLAV